MRYPKLMELPTSREIVEVFRGYNHNLRIGDGEFYDMTNLSSDNYPVLSPRHQRGVYATPTNPQGLARYDNLCYVDGTKLVVDKYPVEMGLSTKAEDCPKQLIRTGAYLIILPDKKWINLTNLTDSGNIDASVSTTGDTTFTMCKVDGAEYENVHVGSVAPAVTETDENGDEVEKDSKDIPLWLDTSGEIHSLKQYSKTMSAWTTIATTYVKISATGIGLPFEEGDGVTISGIENEQLSDLNNTMIVWAKGDNYIVVTGICDKVVTQSAAIKVERRMPTMDFVIESENRLWGCHYGIAQNGEMVNEIYASKLGDFKNWHCFAGVSTDSYAATVGTDGQFTGAITHLGYPLFFKENYIHKVYGNFPANYQINTTACRGVQKGSHSSLAIVNEVLYYKSRSGICSYDGSLPVEVSAALGDVQYHDAVAGTLGNKYYISMADEDGEHHLFVCDTLKGMWHREDDTQVDAFCNCRGDLYYIDHADNCIKTVRGTGVTETAPIKWQAVTGIIGTNTPDKKYISRMDVRMSLSVGTRVIFFAEYDSSGEWEHLFTMDGIKLRTFAVPIRPQRCDHMRLKIVGVGDAKIYSICKTIEQGSDT
jgi:hypothetical protein